MRNRRRFLTAAGIFGLAAAFADSFRAKANTEGSFVVSHDDAYWREHLTPRQYMILRHEGTERPYSSQLNAEHRTGVFACAGCDAALYASDTKFDSGTGWPSFFAPLPSAVDTSIDGSFGATRTEVHCHQCGGHLGHVFKDGPAPTGLRYCMNGDAMTFKPA